MRVTPSGCKKRSLIMGYPYRRFGRSTRGDSGRTMAQAELERRGGEVNIIRATATRHSSTPAMLLIVEWPMRPRLR